MKLTRIFLTLGVLAVPFQGHAAQSFLDGNRLYALAADDPEAFDAYSLAIADVLQTGAAVSGHKACIPLGVTRRQVWDAVDNFLAARPEVRHFTAASLVAGALSLAFPCSDRN